MGMQMTVILNIKLRGAKSLAYFTSNSVSDRCGQRSHLPTKHNAYGMTQATVLAYRSCFSALELKPVEIPTELKSTELVVKVTHAALNPVDIKIKSLDPGFTLYALKDFCGFVERAGRDAAKNWAAGERICGVALRAPFSKNFVGTWAVVDIAADALIKPPARLSNVEAAAFPLTFGTAYQMLEKASLTPESAVLILGGATAVGQQAIQLAKLFYKVKTVVATCSASSSELVRSLGADVVIDYNEPSLSKTFVESTETSGKYSAIIDCVGGYDALRVWPDLLEPASKGSVYATVMGDSPPYKSYAKSMLGSLLSLPWVIFRQLFGSYLGINYFHVVLSGEGNWTKDATAFFANTAAKVVIDSVYELSQFQLAWDRVDSTRAKGKVVIEMDS